MKSFLIQQFFKNVGEVWASSPHLRSKFYWYPICNLFSLLQSHIFKLSRSNLENQGETKAKIQAGQRGDCSTLAGKSRGRTPFCRTLKIVFPKSRIFCKVISRCNCSTGTVARCLFLVSVSQGGAVLFAPPRKAVAFFTTPSVCQKHGTGISLPAGSDQDYSP